MVSLTNLLEMDVAESKALSLLVRLEYRGKLKTKAASIISNTYRYKTAKRQGETDKKRKSIRKLKRHINSFIGISRKAKRSYEVTNIYEVMGSYFDYIKEELQQIKLNQDSIENKLRMTRKSKEITKNSLEKKEISFAEDEFKIHESNESFDSLSNQEIELNSAKKLIKSKI